MLEADDRGSLRAMAGDTDGIKQRIQRSGEDALGKLTQELLDNPLVTGAIAKAFEAREKATAAQEVAMGALNLPSAADLERLTRRLRSVSQRLEGIEDGVDRLDQRLGGLTVVAGIDAKLAQIEEAIDGLRRQVAALGDALPDAPAPLPREQERLEVTAD
jgi:DNA repair exonuclease SbcCD ATPase subunit